jgi:hypothetical protein
LIGEIPIDNAFIMMMVGGLVVTTPECNMAATYLFGDLTSATRASKTCFTGVAVEVEDI